MLISRHQAFGTCSRKTITSCCLFSVSYLRKAAASRVIKHNFLIVSCLLFLGTFFPPFLRLYYSSYRFVPPLSIRFLFSHCFYLLITPWQDWDSYITSHVVLLYKTRFLFSTIVSKMTFVSDIQQYVMIMWCCISQAKLIYRKKQMLSVVLYKGNINANNF